MPAPTIRPSAIQTPLCCTSSGKPVPYRLDGHPRTRKITPIRVPPSGVRPCTAGEAASVIADPNRASLLPLTTVPST